MAKAQVQTISIIVLVLVSFLGVIGFQVWYQGFQTDFLTDSDKKSKASPINNIDIKTITRDALYVHNDYEDLFTFSSISIDNVECSVGTTNFSLGMNEINISDCMNAVSTDKFKINIFIVTDTGINSKTLKNPLHPG